MVSKDQTLGSAFSALRQAEVVKMLFPTHTQLSAPLLSFLLALQTRRSRSELGPTIACYIQESYFLVETHLRWQFQRL